MNLSGKQQRFVDEYLIDLNGTQAAIRAGYSPNSANEQASRMLAKANIAEAVHIAQQKRLERVGIDQDRIIRELLNVVTADANELIEYRRTCCRYCWGKKFGYHRTRREIDDDRAAHTKSTATLRLEASNENRPFVPMPFDEAGGIGYDARREPNRKCQECFGEGIGQAFMKDTRSLSPAARALYAGVKVTKEGMEVKMHDKQGHLTLLMRHAGMLKDKTEISGPNGGPIPLVAPVLNVTVKKA